jgi:hypothetical protein
MSAVRVETGHKLDKQDIGLTAKEPIKDPARFPWQEVTKAAHYWLEVNAMTKPMMVREDSAPYGGEKP